MCVCERERERECVCVCVRETEREGQGIQRQGAILRVCFSLVLLICTTLNC